MVMYKHASTRVRPYGGSVSECFGVIVGKCEEELKEKLRKWNE